MTTAREGRTGVDDAPSAAHPVGRITSLDWVRGWFLCASVASVSVLPPRPPQLEHAAWSGVTAVDLVFPLFVTLSGCGLAFAYRNRVGWRATARRGVVLLACGLAYNAVAAGTVDLATLRWSGPLQVYAVLVVVVGLLHLVARTPGAWALVTAALAAVGTTGFALWARTCPGGELSPGCNPSGTIDSAVLGVHMYAEGRLGHDPEGLVAITGALLTASAGVTAGHLALRSRGTRLGPARVALWAVLCLAAAVPVATLVPVMKRLWTPGFALAAAALGVLLLAIGMALLDAPTEGRWGRVRERVAWPHIALGRNSLLVYFGSHLLMLVLLARGEPSWAVTAAERIDVLGSPHASWIVAMLLGWALLAAVLHARRIYLRP